MLGIIGDKLLLLSLIFMGIGLAFMFIGMIFIGIDMVIH